MLPFCVQAVGEPPLFLAASVFYAIKQAVAAVRADRGLDPVFRFDSPATAERIRMGCQDFLTERVSEWDRHEVVTDRAAARVVVCLPAGTTRDKLKQCRKIEIIKPAKYDGINFGKSRYNIDLH